MYSVQFKYRLYPMVRMTISYGKNADRLLLFLGVYCKHGNKKDVQTSPKFNMFTVSKHEHRKQVCRKQICRHNEQYINQGRVGLLAEHDQSVNKLCPINAIIASYVIVPYELN